MWALQVARAPGMKTNWEFPTGNPPKWKESLAAPDAIKDTSGLCLLYKDCVAIKKADMVTSRDVHIRSRGLQAMQKDIKKPDAENLGKLESQTAKGSLIGPNSCLLSQTTWQCL